MAQLCLTLCNPMNCSTPGLPSKFLEFTQAHVHWVSDAIQPSHPLSSPSPPAFNLSQHQGLCNIRVSSLHQVAKILEFQLQHQSSQWTPRTDFLWDELVGSPCSPRDSQESSPIEQFYSNFASFPSNVHFLVHDLIRDPTLNSVITFPKSPAICDRASVLPHLSWP